MMQGFVLYLIGLECEFDSVAMFSVRKAKWTDKVEIIVKVFKKNVLNAIVTNIVVVCVSKKALMPLLLLLRILLLFE